jgi:heat-inducible transcriptional repressor
MERHVIDHRHEAVLGVVVEHHVMTALPVSSAAVARRSNLRLSAATLRTVMSDLEDQGYLRQRHTSGGRVPTDRGYRLYVDRLMRARGLTTGEKRLILSEMRNACRDVEDILQVACSVLSRIWGQLALALGPSVTEGLLRRIDLLPVASDRVLVVLSVASGVIKTVLVEAVQSVEPGRLEAAARLLNQRLSGLPLSDALHIVGSEPEAFCGHDAGVRHVLVRLADRGSISKLNGELYVEGTSRLFAQPEFESPGMMRPFLQIVEAREPIARELTLSCHHTVPMVVIGRENAVNELQQCSMVAVGYRVGKATGAVGVLGPMRMPYSTLLPAVQFVASAVSDLLSQGRA